MAAPDDRIPDKGRLDDLGRRLDSLQHRAEESGILPPQKVARTAPSSALGSAFKLSTEFVVATVVGGGMGMVLDRWLNTSPAMLLVFGLLGVAAGFYGVFRQARRMQAEDAEKAKTAPALPGDEDED